MERDGERWSGDVTDALAQVSFTVMALLSQVAARHELSLTQLRVLAILRDHRPRMAELAAHLGLEKSTVTGLVDRAVRRGLLRRAPSPEDGRAATVVLTDDGARLAAALEHEIQHVLAPLLGRLSAADGRRLGELLMRTVG
ncbi:MarR family winged helix-turn-helix transcriptional regulator [Nakamurella endophytica]|uniref:MarR family transcriptional regulator n=1 Tax=Nakamurella endophytica TaxID=1748367 RepID=A0A917WFM0_9ACTN|nr:MarR family transcriptional regulator [Nakamurella endophytica]GGM00414.1 MarR family transcriptional regulator [Nakamurella endophytica]